MNMSFRVETREYDAALQNLGGMVSFVENTVSNFQEKLDKKVSEKDFSILEHVCHLRDLENEGYLARMTKMLAETTPHLPDFDGDRIARERDYQTQEAGSALNDFKNYRQQSVNFFRSLSKEQLERTAELEGVGLITLENLLCLMLQHDEAHVKELNQLITQI
jgi:hypothetical protein